MASSWYDRGSLHIEQTRITEPIRTETIIHVLLETVNATRGAREAHLLKNDREESEPSTGP